MHAVHTSHRNTGTYHMPYNEAKKPDTGPHGLHKTLAQNVDNCLMSSCLVKNLLEHLIYKRGIGHTGIYKKLCFRLRSPNWHSRGCKKEQLYTCPEIPVIGWTEMSSGPSWCLPEYVALYLSESQLVPTVTVTWGSWDIIRVFSLSIT